MAKKAKEAKENNIAQAVRDMKPVDIDIEAIEDDLGIDIIEEVIEEAETIKEDVKVVEKEDKASKAADIINKIKNSTPEYADVVDNMTPKQLDALFLLGDQGKTIRRYLRKYFAENHIHKNGWNLTKKEATEVIAFLSTRYGQPHWDAFKKLSQVESKEEAKA
jgi:hypothetical protein